jgi:hypothetical protein
MQEPLTVHLDEKPVRFTPDGKVSVVDAIEATMHSNRAHDIWETLKDGHPEILHYCEDYPFQEETPIPVVDSTGWEMIMTLLFCYLSNDDREKSGHHASIG